MLLLRRVRGFDRRRRQHAHCQARKRGYRPGRSIAALTLLDPLADRGERFSPLQPVKQFLVAFGVLTRRCPRDR